MTFSVYPFLSNSCRYYGLSVWFPDVIKHLQADDYASKVQWHTNEQTEDFTFNFTLENQVHTNGVFIKDRYTSLIQGNKCDVLQKESLCSKLWSDHREAG